MDVLQKLETYLPEIQRQIGVGAGNVHEIARMYIWWDSIAGIIQVISTIFLVVVSEIATYFVVRKSLENESDYGERLVSYLVSSVAVFITSFFVSGILVTTILPDVMGLINPDYMIIHRILETINK